MVCTEVIQSAQGMEYLLGETTTAVTVHLLSRDQLYPSYPTSVKLKISPVTQSLYPHSYLLLMRPCSLHSNRQAMCSGYLLPISVLTLSHRAALTSCTCSCQREGAQGAVVTYKQTVKSLWDPALAIVTGAWAGHVRSELGSLVLQSNHSGRF